MIKNFRDNWLEEFYEQAVPHRKIQKNIESRLFRKLQMIDAARKQRDLLSPPSNCYEGLKGDLDGWSSIRVNIKGRIVFKWDDNTGEASDVWFDPNHTYGK